jgi:hypothetical protein
MPDQPAHQPAIGILLSYTGSQPENPADSPAVAAEVAWGVTPYLAPRVTAGSEKEAITLLRSGLRKHASRPLLLFDDLQEAEEERYRNLRAGVLLLEAFNPQNRARLEELLSGDPDILRQSLDRFDRLDRLAHQLSSIEAGRHDPQYLVVRHD